MACAGPRASVGPEPLLAPAQVSNRADTPQKEPRVPLQLCAAQEAGPSAGGPKACVLRSLDEAPGRITVLRAPLWPTLSVKKWIRGLLIHTRTRQLDAKGARILSSVSQPASPAAPGGCGRDEGCSWVLSHGHY